jgi:ABC-type lipoprotein export system ATPase subunit
LMVTHDTQVASIATRRLYLDRGKFVEADEAVVSHV